MEHSPDIVAYEELSAGTPLSVHIIAGGLAGIMEHCLVYPIDTIKTKMQSLNPAATKTYTSLSTTISSIRSTQGLRSTFRGINIIALGSGPAHALYFTSYEAIKESLIAHLTNPSHRFNTSPGTAPYLNTMDATHPLISGTAAVVATLLHDALMNPFEVVKQRLQMYNSPYASSLDCVKKMVRAEPLSAFYWSYKTQLSINIPFQMIHFTLYENLTAVLQRTIGTKNKDGSIQHYNPLVHILAGGLSGGAAGALTTPLDILKTVLNTQEAALVAAQKHAAKPISSMVSAAAYIYATAGLSGFLKGAQARILFHIPSTAVCWSVYEFFKFFLKK